MHIVRDYFGLDRTTVTYDCEITGVGGNADAFYVVAEVTKSDGSPATRTAPRLASEHADDLDVRTVLELIDRHHLLDGEAGSHQNCRVTREGPCIARDADDPRHARTGNLPCLCFGAGPGRIEHHRIKFIEFRAEKRAPEEISCFRRDSSQSGRETGRPVERRNGRPVQFDGMNLRTFRKPEGEWAAAAEEIRDRTCIPAAFHDQLRQNFLATACCLQE